MKNQGVFIATRPSKTRCLILIFLISLLYILDNFLFLNSDTINYFLIPLLWLGTAYIVWRFPNIRPKGLLRFRASINLWAFNFGVIFIVASIGAGMINGFGKSPYSHSPKGILMNIFLVGTMLIGRELVRSYIVNTFTKKENFLIFIAIAFFMAVINIPVNQILNFNRGYSGMVQFAADTVIPELSHSLLATYMVFLGGPIASIIYFSIIEGFHWLSPVLPNLQWITEGLVGILCPIFCLMSLQGIYMSAAKLVRKRDIDKENPVSWIITSIISIGIVWFAAGVFPIYPSVIATGSMEPMIKPGDVIIVENIDASDVKVGDVVQFRKKSIFITHRVIEKLETYKGTRYRTKGDNNSQPDTELVKPSQIRGRILYVVPKIGWPTLLIKSKRDIPLEEVMF